MLNVLSLFDGISCGQVALNRTGIKIGNYYASEIDKFAISIATKNFKGIKHIGCVKNVNSSNLPGIDILIGGSPCQGFSFSGKQLNFNDERSRLFFEFARILKDISPKYFILENVCMKKEYQQVISEILGVDPICINSSLVSAQSRKRLYWTNIPQVSQPKDRNMKLADILEQSPQDPVIMSHGTIERFKRYGVKLMSGKEDKAKCLSAMEYVKNGKQGNYLEFFHEGVMRYRKLTPIECERLQTLPDDYTYGKSNTQRYKALGNAWTVEVITHIINCIPRKGNFL